MNFKTTYILFGLLGLMLAILGIVLYFGPSAPPGEGYVFPTMHAKDKELKVEDVDKVVVVRKRSNEPDLVFERVDSTAWKITSPAEGPADGHLLSGLVDQILNAKNEKEGNVPTTSKAGLDDPTRVITLQAKDRVWTLKVGDTTPGKEGALVYVMSSDLPGKTLAVPKNKLESALEGYEYYRAKELLGENSADIRSIKLAQGKKPPVELKKEKDRWVMTRPAYGDVEVGELPTQLTNLRVEHKDAKTSDFVENGVTDLTKYPELAPTAEALRIDVTRGDGDKQTTRSTLIGTSKKVGDKSYYAVFDASAKAKDVVKVSADSVAPILKWVDDPGAFRSKNLLALENFRQPDAILIKNKHGDLEFFRADEKDPWQLYRGSSSHAADPTEVRKLIDELNKKNVVVTFPDPKRRKDLVDKPDVTVRVFADSLEKPDAKKPGKPVFKKDAKPVAELRFGLPEGVNVAVDRIWGSDATLVMVPESLDLQVRKGPLAYFDRSIPAFNPGSAEEGVTKVELSLAGKTYVVTRSASTGPWIIEQPAALKGRNADAQAVRGILGDLNRLSAREIVSEKADDKDLATYNLKTPPVRVVVTLTKDGKPVPTTFDFGKEEGGAGVYLKISGRDAIYLVGAETLVPLKRELRDTAVFAFDPSKVAGLTITGWQKVQGAPESLKATRKDGTWTATVPPAYPVDSAKLSAFVADLSRLRLERFVTGGSGFDLKEDALQIEVTMADKTVHELSIGAADGAGFFARSKQLPGDTFVVGKTPFETIRADGKKYFVK